MQKSTLLHFFWLSQVKKMVWFKTLLYKSSIHLQMWSIPSGHLLAYIVHWLSRCNCNFSKHATGALLKKTGARSCCVQWDSMNAGGGKWWHICPSQTRIVVCDNVLYILWKIIHENNGRTKHLQHICYDISRDEGSINNQTITAFP